MQLCLWGVVSFFFFLASLATNLTLQLLFGTLTALYYLLAAGVTNDTANKVSASGCQGGGGCTDSFMSGVARSGHLPPQIICWGFGLAFDFGSAVQTMLLKWSTEGPTWLSCACPWLYFLAVTPVSEHSMLVMCWYPCPA